MSIRSPENEVKKLYYDPSAASLEEKLPSEHDRLAKEFEFCVHNFVDRPPNWGKPGSLSGDLADP